MSHQKRDPLEGLNPQQAKAVEHFTGPLLILAGAGTGKTRVITHRIAWLIEGLGVPPSQILALTFTNKAAGEMRDRTVALVGDHARGALLSTFHSFCNYVLRREIARLGGYREGYSIYDESDSRSCIRDIIKSMELPASGPFAPARICAVISRAKNFGADPAQYLSLHDPLSDHIHKIAEAYEKRLLDNNALDFDNLLVKALEIFENHLDVRHRYRQRFQYILVDEYQDTNRMQYELLKRLAPPDGNLTVVGDLDQSIYGWRGADAGNMIAFEQDFQNVEVVPLEQNYRSKQRILDAANALIAHNPGFHEKHLWSELGDGEPVFFHIPWDERSEADFIASETDHLLSEGYRFDDIAAMFRTRAQSRVLEEIFMRAAIPYVLIGATEFYHRKEIKDIIAYLRVIENPRDFVSFARIANEPRRGVGKKGLSRIEELAREAGSLFGILKNEDSLPKEFPKKGVPFLKMLQKFHLERAEYPLPKLVEEVANQSGYREYLDRQAKEEGISRTENLDEFISLATEYEMDTARPTLEGFLSHVALISDVDVRETGEGHVRLMTLHSAKGLEFPVVFISGVEEGLLPHSSSMETTRELEEERRLFYVGVTRARELLYMTACRSRLVHGQVVHNRTSRFFTEIGQTHFKVLGESRGAEPAGRSFFDRDPELDDELESGKPHIRKKREKRKSSRAAEDDETVYDDAADFDAEPVPPPRRKFAHDAGGFTCGDRIEHAIMGKGTVVSIRGDEIGISFPGRGVKHFSVRFAPLKKI